MIRQLINFFLISILLLTCSTCKKISKYPDDLYGEWISYSRCRTHLIIKKDGNGEYGSFLQDKGCDGKAGASGKVRFNKSHLYIGLTKFKFIEQSKRLDGKDSIYDCLPSVLKNQTSGCANKYPKLAIMTLKNPKSHTGETITYYKIKDY